jgi:hypothetical protein
VAKYVLDMLAMPRVKSIARASAAIVKLSLATLWAFDSVVSGVSHDILHIAFYRIHDSPYSGKA